MVCCFHPPITYIWRFSPCYPFPTSPHPTVSPLPIQQTPVCDVPLPVSMCSQCSTLTYEWEHAVFDFLFLYQFAENYGFQIHPCPYKGHKLIVSYDCVVFHGVYVSHFPCLVYYWWAFEWVPGHYYCKQYSNEHTCACVFIIKWFVMLWARTK